MRWLISIRKATGNSGYYLTIQQTMYYASQQLVNGISNLGTAILVSRGEQDLNTPEVEESRLFNVSVPSSAVVDWTNPMVISFRIKRNGGALDTFETMNFIHGRAIVN